MGPVVINATDLRVRTREIMERVKYKGEKFLVQTFGQPTAVIISVDEYKELTSGNQSKLEQMGQLTAIGSKKEGDDQLG